MPKNSLSPELKALLDRYHAFKTKWTAEKRRALPDWQFAGTDGESFPIADQSDVQDAWDLRGHDDDPEQCGKNILRIAAKLGLKAPSGSEEDGGKEKSEKKEVDLVCFGGAVKALSDGKIGGYLVLFGDENATDLEGDFFTKSTDFDLARSTKTSVYYAHALDPELKTTKLGVDSFEMKVDDVGVWVEGQLNLRDRYEKAIYGMAQKGKLGWSSGTAAHLVERKQIGDANEILKWPLGLDASLTPTPAESRTKAVAVKGLKIPSFSNLLEVKSIGLSASDRLCILNDAVRVKVKSQSGTQYRWAWIVDVFDTTLVYICDDGDGDTDYFEVPYTFDGNVPTIGEAVQVVRTTKYEPMGKNADDDDSAMAIKTISDALKSLIDLRFVDHSDSVRTAVKGYMQRVSDYAQLREDRGRRLSEDRAEEFKAIRQELENTLKALDDALTLAPTPATEATSATLDELRRDALMLDPVGWN